MIKSQTPSLPKLSAAQQQLVAAAAASSTGGLALPAELKGKTAAKAVEALTGLGLLREVRTKADLPVWRQDDTGRRYSLVLTKAGHAAAKALATSAVDPRRERGEGGAAAKRDVEASMPRTGSKLAAVIALLQRPAGAPVSDLMAATGWLPHTTRAALTGLRKRGYMLVREAAEGGSVYRIAEPAAVTPGASTTPADDDADASSRASTSAAAA